jgi:glyoxylate carboligase
LRLREVHRPTGCLCGYSRPGGIHLLNGLYDAKLDQVPVLAITGMTFHDLAHTYSQQDVELDKLFMVSADRRCVRTSSGKVRPQHAFMPLAARLIHRPCYVVDASREPLRGVQA